MSSTKEISIGNALITGGHCINGGSHGKVYTIRKDVQEGKAQNRSGPAADLGRAESRHEEAGEQQCIQPKQSPELEA